MSKKKKGKLIQQIKILIGNVDYVSELGPVVDLEVLVGRKRHFHRLQEGEVLHLEIRDKGGE